MLSGSSIRGPPRASYEDPCPGLGVLCFFVPDIVGDL